MTDINFEKYNYKVNLEKKISEEFEAQVINFPHYKAVIFQNKALTYHQLNCLANKYAHILVKNFKAKYGDLIILCINRSIELLPLILAILKAGCIYVPIDPNSPQEKIVEILKNLDSRLIITTNDFKKIFDKVSIQFNKKLSIIYAESREISILINKSNEVNVNTNKPDIAYIVYTSGSTGEPKAIPTKHISAINCINSFFKVYDFKLGFKAAAFTSIAFDVSILEFFSILFRGGEVHILSDETKRDPFLLSNYLIEKKINFIYLPPALLTHLPKFNYPDLKVISYGGESCPTNTAKAWYKKYKLYNIYGTTETTIHSSIQLIQNPTDVKFIGKPIDNTKFYVVDNNLREVETGTIGELLISGIGLSPGYLSKLSNSSKFIKNHLLKRENDIDIYSHLYITNDIVKKLKNEKIEFIGRNGSLLKIKGYRVDLKEIEEKVYKISGIDQAVITNQDTKIILYYVSNSGVQEGEVQKLLGQALPHYMIPTPIIKLRSITLNTNGKIDKVNLPKTNDKLFFDNNLSELQKSIRRIVAKVLKIPEIKIKIKDSFYNLGCDSINAIEFIGKFRDIFKVDLGIREFELFNTIEKLEQLINKSKLDNILKKANQKTPYIESFPLLPIQEWFLNNNFEATINWHPSFIVPVESNNIIELKSTLINLLERHDIFKIKFKFSTKNNKNTYEQYIEENPILVIDSHKINNYILNVKDIGFNSEIYEKTKEYNKQINIFKGNLYKICIFYNEKNSNVIIYFCIHHILIDLVSIHILVDELYDMFNYTGYKYKGDSRSVLKFWGVANKRFFFKNNEEIAYWSRVSSNITEIGTDPLKNIVSLASELSGTHFKLTQKYNKKLSVLGKKSKNIVPIFLLALAYTIYKINKKKINYICFITNGRNEKINNINPANIIGWLTTFVPLKLKILKTYETTYFQLKRNLNSIPTSGLGFGNIIGYKENLLPKISFNYLGKDSDKYILLRSNIPNDYNENLSITLNIEKNIFYINIASKLNKKATLGFSKEFKETIIEILDSKLYETITLNHIQNEPK